MFGLNRKKRPVELGPYPLEKLKRDPAIIAEEAARPAGAPVTMPTGSNAYLVGATNSHLDAYAELREPEPFKKLAPVPDDLKRRMRDIKGAGYFLDASQIGICEIVDSVWLNGAASDHSHAVAVLVEYSAPIDAGNKAAGWVAGNEHLLATLLAAEIAIDVSGQISCMGFTSRVHWTGATDVDLGKVAVLAGLAIRDGDKLINPYLETRFAVAVIMTNYALATDLPLHASARNGKNLSYQLGLAGAISGLERWRQKRRPSHLGAYPVETLKRVPRLTTEVFDDEVPRVPSRTNMYVRTAFGDLSKKAMGEADRWSQKHPVSQGIVRPSWAIKALQDGQTAAERAPNSDNPDDNTKALKALSLYLGSTITGVCKVPDYAWYSHDKRGNPIEPYHKYALVAAIDQGYETFLGASGNDWISGSQSMRAYLRGGEVVGVMADMIRKMGYGARAHSNLDSHVLHVPLVLQAGLGEQSRVGESAINPFLGMRFKTAVLTTDMPITPDLPIDFGVQLFCSKCLKCARECPSQAIPYGDKTMFNGYETWKPDSERCTMYRATNLKGSACGRCVKVCPLSKDTTWDGPLLHQIGSWLGVNAMWLKPILAPIAIWLDDVLGNGNPIDEKKWWLDLEVIGKRSFRYDAENTVEAAKGTNRPMIDPGKKPRGADNIAHFPASTLPPPLMMEPCPTDRKLGLKIAAEAETVEEGLKRRAEGGPIPETYIPSYAKKETAE
ncbi:MAG: 4Fe-4S dicluster domain-containing protein [Rhodospirillaceae bacterium]|nr:4Fe-4S dicluster domain-containing protein [Rhodospirillaceae bacterium]